MTSEMKCDKYYFTIFGNETDGMYEFSNKYHQYSCVKDFLVAHFKDKMGEAEKFYMNTRRVYTHEDIEIIRMHIIGWKVCIRRYKGD